MSVLLLTYWWKWKFSSFIKVLTFGVLLARSLLKKKNIGCRASEACCVSHFFGSLHEQWMSMKTVPVPAAETLNLIDKKKKKEKSNVLFRHMQRLCVQGFQTGQMVERVNLRPTTKNTSSTFSFFIRHRGGGGQAARDTWFWYFPLVSLSTVLSLTLSQSKTKALHWQPQYSALQKVRNFYFSAVWTATRTLMLG